MNADHISPTFCILPWIHFATYTNGNVSSCCVAHCDGTLNLNHHSIKEIWNSDLFKNTRLRMLRGEKLPQCEYCYKQEASGLSSHRIDENNIWLQRLKEGDFSNLIEKTHNDGSLGLAPSTMDLRPTNRCNLKCVICGPSESSIWNNDANYLAENLTTNARNDWIYRSQLSPQSNYRWFSQKRILSELVELLPSTSHIIFGGGEPLLLEEHDSLINQAIEKGLAGKIELRYHTNGTLLKEKHLSWWKHFKHVQVMISMDGPPKINDYIRYPSKWRTYLQTLKLLDNSPPNIEPQILYSVSLLNFSSIVDFSEWLLNQNYKKIGFKNHHRLFHPGIVFWPTYLSVTALPKEEKEIITEKVNAFINRTNNPQAQSFAHIANHMNSSDDSYLLPQTIDYLSTLDRIRKTNYEDTFPHLRTKRIQKNHQN